MSFAPVARAQETTPSGEDALDPLRERFRTGIDKYRAGAFAEAILIWENIYRELGPEKGYRLAFNLARAYEQFGDPTRAAESYDAYVEATARRREAGEALEPLVEKQEAEAKARLLELAATQGRIRIAGHRAVLVKIDGGPERRAPASGWIAYVTPRKTHVVTFDPGTKEEQNVEVKVGLGELVELSPPPAKERGPSPESGREPPQTPARSAIVEERPYSPVVLYTAAGATAIATVVSLALYANASSIEDDYAAAASRGEASSVAGDQAGYAAAERTALGLHDDYESARSTAHLSLAVPVVLGAATLGLTAYWLVGSKPKRVGASVAPLTGGAFFGAGTRF
ncbi:MAG TPA: hypothetical protein VM925_32070 [Labilithrix sp.]|nr:hypothetical protein [Labilithrix sp.]